MSVSWSGVEILKLVKSEAKYATFAELFVLACTGKKKEFPKVLWIRKCQGQGRFTIVTGQILGGIKETFLKLHCP